MVDTTDKKLQKKLSKYFEDLTKTNKINKYQISRICWIDPKTYEKMLSWNPIASRTLRDIKSNRSIFVDDVQNGFIDACSLEKAK